MDMILSSFFYIYIGTCINIYGIYIKYILQAANLREFHAAVNPRFEDGIPDFMRKKLNTF